MSGSTLGTNQVCFSCRVKLAGIPKRVRHGYSEGNKTFKCGRCGQQLTEVRDNLCFPKSNDIAGWKLMEIASLKGELHKFAPHYREELPKKDLTGAQKYRRSKTNYRILTKDRMRGKD